jgi:hypothetical protein
MNHTRSVARALCVLIAFVMLSGMFLATVRANPWPNLPPTPVTMQVADGTASYFVTTLSNVPPGYDVTNGVYVGWCVDKRYTIPRNVNVEVQVYSSLSPPLDLASQRWDMVNYILNHKQGLMMDVQDAIWYFIKMDGIGWWSGSAPSATALAIVADALANGSGYVPGPGELMAVICDPTSTQITLIEITRVQYYLTVKADPSGAATIPGQGWYDPATTQTLTAPQFMETPFLYWDVDGVSQGETVKSITVMMNAYHTATAHYYVPGVGGEWAPINTVQLVTPWIAYAFLAIASAVALSHHLLKKRW